jgi:hypothetical protein
VEAPLELQDYSAPSNCISDWVLFVPPTDGAGKQDLAEARSLASDWIDSVKKGCPTCMYTEDPKTFSNWLLQDIHPLPTTPRQALVVLSQYKDNRLYFSDNDNPPSVPSGSIRRILAPPSFAILDACGTAAPGQSEFIRNLNAHGVSTLISTSTAIPGPMGGKFLSILMELLAKHPQYTISRARYEAVKALRWESTGGKPYGPQALAFTLVGNGNLHVCMPGK